MNWFERYGIVGMFFIIITGIWFFCLYPNSYSLLISLKEENGLCEIIIGFCTLGFLPIGYLIVILGQFFYYDTSLWEKIHCTCWNKLPQNIKKVIQKEEKEQWKNDLLDEYTKDKANKMEADMEAILSYYDRMWIDKLEKHKFLASFGTKRYDVISINRGLTVAIFISFFLAVCFKLIFLMVTILTFWKSLGWGDIFAPVFLGINILIWLCLRESSRILENQIINVEKRILLDINLTKENKG